MGKQFTLYTAEAHSEPCQKSLSKGEVFSILSSQKDPTWMFDKVLYKPLLIK